MDHPLEAAQVYLEATRGRVGGVRALVRQQEVVDACISVGVPILIAVSAAGLADGVEVLLESGASALQTNSSGHTSLMTAAAGGHAKCVQLLLAAAPAALNVADRAGRTALAWAGVAGSPACIEILLEAGADAEAVDERGMSPLMWACVRGSVELGTNNSLSTGAGSDAGSTSAADPASNTLKAFNQRRQSGKVSTACVAALIRHSASVNAASCFDGTTALIWAARNPSPTSLQLLLDAGAETEHADHDESTALTEAASAGHIENVRALLAAGANPSARAKNGQTARQLAEAVQCRPAVQLLRAAEMRSRLKKGGMGRRAKPNSWPC